MASSNKKWVRIPSAIPYYITAAVVLLWGLITPIYKLSYMLIGASLGVAAYIVGKKLFPGRSELVNELKFSGDQELDQQIKNAREILERFKAVSLNSDEGEMKKQLTRISNATEAIIDEVVRDASDRAGTYTFFSYYLPTLDKLMNFHQSFTGSGENVTEGKRRVVNSLKMVADAFEKQQDNLYKNEYMDIKTDISVLETMLHSEGLIDRNAQKETNQTMN